MEDLNTKIANQDIKVLIPVSKDWDGEYCVEINDDGKITQADYGTPHI